MRVLEAVKLSKVFNKGKSNEVVAVKDCTLEVSKGEVWVFAGPSGCGKTTLLSMLGLMSRPTSGRLKILEKETTRLTERERTLFRRKHIGFLFQDFHLLPYLTVMENLELVQYPEGVPVEDITRRAEQLLNYFGLENKKSQKVSSLSGGEKQRVSLARALMNDPEILIVDEPTAHLDSKRSKEIISLLESLKNQGLTILIASHDPMILEASFIDYIASMRDGEVISIKKCSGTSG